MRTEEDGRMCYRERKRGKGGAMSLSILGGDSKRDG